MRYAFLLGLSALLFAQDRPRFEVRAPLVMAPVNVTDDKGRLVNDLEAFDFLVFDNGRPQKATVDTMDTGVAPIALVVAVQSSGISAAVIEKTRKIGTMIQPMVIGERGAAALVSFDQKVNWLQNFTNDEDVLDDAFGKLRPFTRPGEDKEACMLDAVHEAIERLRAIPNARRVLLLISESRDRGSETTLEAAIMAAQSAGVAIYALNYSALKTAFTSKLPVAAPRRALKPKMPEDVLGWVNGMPPGLYNPWPKHLPPEQQVDVKSAVGELMRLGKTNTAEALTKATGGATLSFSKQRALEDAIQRFGTELHSQYVISFAPDDLTPGYHRIEVRLARPGKMLVHARPGYWTTQ
ncbi:MAG: VWA domain-containing protein [Candidatus Solibacter sp.]